MPISRGQDWGAPGLLPGGAPIAHGDVELARFVSGPHLVVGLDGGDMARTLGVRPPYDRSAAKQLLPIDAVEVRLDDGAPNIAIAHIVAGRMRVERHVVAIMNVAFINKRNIAPRAHPGDGKADIVSLDLSVADRFKARKRMITASHLPHAGIELRRSERDVIDLGARRVIHVDGRFAGHARRLAFTIIPDAITIAV